MNGPDLARLGRAVMPLAKEVFEAAAVEAGVCIRPVSMSVADTTTGEVSIIDVPIAGGLLKLWRSSESRSMRH